MRVLVVGGGIGGLTAALCLIQRGFGVDAHEQAAAFREVGAGLQLGPNAMKVFDGLGLSDEIVRAGVLPEAIELRDGETGETTFRLSIREKRYGAPYVHIHRADLIDILSRALAARSPGSLKLTDRVMSVRPTDTGVIAELASGKGLRTPLLIGADGVQSMTRTALHGETSPEYSGFVAWRGVVPATPELKRLIPKTACAWSGPNRHVVTYFIRGGEAVNFVGVVPRADPPAEDWQARGNLEDLAADFAGVSPALNAVISSAERAFQWAIMDRAPLKRWSVGHATLLGDAAHPMPPFMAQGAAMAIEDAAVLVRQIHAHGRGDVTAALAAYEAKRKPRTDAVRRASWRNIHIFHGTGGAWGRSLRFGMRLSARVMPELLRRQTDWIYRWSPKD